MRSLYENFIRSLKVFFLFPLLAILLTGCVTGGGYKSSPSAPTTGYVTQDPNSVPKIAWQTNQERDILAQQSETADNRPSLQTVIGGEAIPYRVRVALLVPLTGKYTQIGQAMLNAAQMALFDIGSAHFELDPHDTRSTPEGAARAAQAAVAKGADLILGPIFSDDVRMVKPIAASANIPVVAFTTDWKHADENTYILGFLPFAQVARVANFAKTKDVQNFTAFAPKTDYADIVINTLYRTNVRVIGVGRYDPTQTDISADVQNFVLSNSTARPLPDNPDNRDLKFDAVMLPLGGEGLDALVAMLDGNGVNNDNVRLIGTGLWDEERIHRNAAMEGGWFAAPDPKQRMDFERRYQQNYESLPPRLSSLAYDATALAAVLARSAEGGEPYTREKLTNRRGFAGIDGVFRLRPDGLNDRGLAILEIRNGRAVVIDPAPTAFISPSGT